MSEDELIEEFTWRIKKLAHRACPGDPDGHFIFRGKGYTAFRAGIDASYPLALGVIVLINGELQNIFLNPIEEPTRIFVEQYEAEEILQRMREDMILDDISNV